MLISISGVDGSGKTTLRSNLADLLSRKGGVRVHEIKNPSPAYAKNHHIEAFRANGTYSISIEAMALLSAFDRLEQFETEVKPRLAAEEWVIMDRFILDGLASFTYRGVDHDWVRSLNRHVPWPDLAFFIDCPPTVAIERIRQRGGKMTYDEKSIEILEQKHNAFNDWVGRLPVIRIDGLMSPSDVLNEVHGWITKESSRPRSRDR